MKRHHLIVYLISCCFLAAMLTSLHRSSNKASKYDKKEDLLRSEVTAKTDEQDNDFDTSNQPISETQLSSSASASASVLSRLLFPGLIPKRTRRKKIQDMMTENENENENENEQDDDNDDGDDDETETSESSTTNEALRTGYSSRLPLNRLPINRLPPNKLPPNNQLETGPNFRPPESRMPPGLRISRIFFTCKLRNRRRCRMRAREFDMPDNP